MSKLGKWIITTALAVLVVVPVLLMLMLPLYILYGFVLSILWGWFIVPIFHVQQISIAAAIGISLVVGFLTRENVNQMVIDNKDKDELIKSLICVIVSPFVLLFVGYVVHLFM